MTADAVAAQDRADRQFAPETEQRPQSVHVAFGRRQKKKAAVVAGAIDPVANGKARLVAMQIDEGLYPFGQHGDHRGDPGAFQAVQMQARRRAGQQGLQRLDRPEQDIQRLGQFDLRILRVQLIAGPSKQRPGDVDPIGVARPGVFEYGVAQFRPVRRSGGCDF